MPAILAMAYGSFVGSSTPVKSASSRIGCGTARGRCTTTQAVTAAALPHKGLMDDIRLDHQVVVDEVGGIAVVCQNPTHLGGGKDHHVGALGLHKRPHCGLIGQVQLGWVRVMISVRRVPATAAGSPCRPCRDDLRDRFSSPSPFDRYGQFKPVLAQQPVRRAPCRSSATISAHISCAVISGTQPSFSLALVGSPRSVSTSAGRK